MKFLKAPPRLSLIGMAALVLNVGLSGCTTSNSPSMPTTEAQSANVAPAAHLRLAAAPIHESGTGEGDGFGPNQCDSPPFPTVCVPKAKGAYSELGIEVTYGSGPAPGIWTWSATIVDSNGKPTKMVATFSPNPGNPTTETIDWKNAKDDDYTQTIEVCNSSSQCISTTGNVYVFTAGDFSGGLRKVVSAFPDPVSVGVARLDLTNEDGTARGRLDRPDIPFACNKPWWINWEWVCIPFHGSVTDYVNIFYFATGASVPNCCNWLVVINGPITAVGPATNPTQATFFANNARRGHYLWSMKGCTFSSGICLTLLKLPLDVY